MPTGLNLLPSDGEAYLVNDALSAAEADRYLDLLRDRIDWRQESARLMGRSIQIPRLSAWYGTAGYRYSGIMHALQPLTEELQELQAVVEDLAGLSFNGVLLNLYRDGQDSVGWHADNEAGDREPLARRRPPLPAQAPDRSDRAGHPRPAARIMSDHARQDAAVLAASAAKDPRPGRPKREARWGGRDIDPGVRDGTASRAT